MEYLRKLNNRLIEELSFHLMVKLYEFNQTIFEPGDSCDGIYFVMKGVVEVFVRSGADEVIIDYLGKGSVVGQYSVLGRDSMLFGMRAVMAGGTALMVLEKETMENLRMKKHELD